jgi:hypothetical protein
MVAVGVLLIVIIVSGKLGEAKWFIVRMEQRI